MTPEEIKARNAADSQVQQSIELDEPETSGIRPPPQIEVSEQTLDGEIFGFEFAGQPFSTAEPGASAPPPTNEGACCDGCDCTITTEAECAGTYMGDGTTCSPNPCGSSTVRRCCFCDGGCEDLTECQCNEEGGMWGSPGEICGDCSGGSPCCPSKHYFAHITGTITYDDGLNPSCTWTIDDTLEGDSFCQDSGCDGDGYPGCCLVINAINDGPNTIDGGTDNEHTVSFSTSVTDNFNGTADILVAMQINPFSADVFCNNAATVDVTCSGGGLDGVDCDETQLGTCSDTDSTGNTSWDLSFEWYFG